MKNIITIQATPEMIATLLGSPMRTEEVDVSFLRLELFHILRNGFTKHDRITKECIKELNNMR